MKIVSIKTKNGKDKFTPDSFVILSLIQCAFLIISVFLIFAVSRMNENLFVDIKNEISEIFSEDFDIGGYFTETETKETESLYLSSLSGNSTEILSAKPLLEYCEPNENEVFLEEKTSEETSFSPLVEVFSDFGDCAVMPVNGTVTSNYGSREHPVYSGESFHEGIDIAADEGSFVYAVKDGTVIEAGCANTAGNYVKIKHSDNTETFYCHCKSILVQEGTLVRKGETIALVGSTGLATGPHLHFELRENGTSINPEKILKGAKSVY